MPLPKQTFKLYSMDELVAMDTAELKQLQGELRTQIAQVRIYSDPKNQPRTKAKRHLKKSLARVLTLLKRYEQAPQPDETSANADPSESSVPGSLKVSGEQMAAFLAGSLATPGRRDLKLALARMRKKKLAKRSKRQYLRRATMAKTAAQATSTSTTST